MTFDVTPEIAMRALWLTWWLSWWAAALWSDRSVKRPGRERQLVYRVFVMVGAILLFGLYRDSAGSAHLWRTPNALAWAMLVPAIAGLAFTWWARLHLGRLWSSNVARKAGHRIVDTGPYAIVRHPIYTGIILASIATATLRGTLDAWIGVGLMTIGWYVKARMEEGFLRAELGEDDYNGYARRVPMLIPLTQRIGGALGAGD